MTLAKYKKIFTIKENENGFIIAKYRSKDPIVDIPSLIDNKPVVAIDAMAFKGKDIEEVTIPDTVKTIGERAFCECKKLHKITLPKEVKIDKVVFYGCASLADDKGFVIVNDILFRYMGNDKDIIIPDGVKRIDDGAFEFNRTIESVIVPCSVTVIRNGAFYGCRKLSSLKIMNLDVKISDGAFDSCPKLLDKDGFIIFNDYLYQYLGSEKEVTIPSTVKTIGKSSFPVTSAIKAITIPSSVTTIGAYAFWYTSDGLESVIIPSSVVEIGHNAFAMCEKVVITAPKDSYAIQYAKDNNISYLEI